MSEPSLKTILVPDVDEARTAPVLCAAQRIAQATGARSAVMVALDVPPPMPSDWGAMAVEMYAHLYQEARARAEARAEALKARHTFKTEMDDVAKKAMFPQNERLKTIPA